MSVSREVLEGRGGVSPIRLGAPGGLVQGLPIRLRLHEGEALSLALFLYSPPSRLR